jgi:hypothetical protein
MTTQIEHIRRHLEAGKSITPAQAIAVYGIFRLASVIEDLRQKGMEIDCVLRFDEMGKQYGTYSLRVPPSVGALVQVKPGNGVLLPNWVRKLKSAKVVGKNEDASLVSFVRGKNHAQVWLNDKELVRVQ